MIIISPGVIRAELKVPSLMPSNADVFQAQPRRHRHMHGDGTDTTTSMPPPRMQTADELSRLLDKGV